MIPSDLHYFPVGLPFFLILAGLLIVTASFVFVRLLSFASTSMGVGPSTMLTVLMLSLLGSYVNIPIAVLPEHEISALATVTFFGIPYAVPVAREWPATLLAINVGGAVIPIVFSFYLIGKNRIYGLALLATTIVALMCHALARPVPGLGIAEPVFVPPIATAITAVLLSRRYAAALAYISGSLGTLIGADLLNLNKVQGLGAPIVSIGGAGTFDGIFVTALVAVLYASVVTHGQVTRRTALPSNS